ncbi:hypothetical protein [Halopelagius inordinatus]|nr:hypothetical protein [Halopelagius inordinatus]
MRHTKSLVALLALALVAAAVAPAAVSAAPTAQTTVEQNPETGSAVVTVLQNDTAVENATVDVAADGNYSGTGTYRTDADGAVELPEPAATVDVNLTVTVDGSSSTTTEELVPREESLDALVEQADDGTATVTVTQYGTAVENATVAVAADGNYSGTGNYTADADGRVELVAPDETQNVTVTATYDDLTAESTTELATTEAELRVGVTQQSGGVEIDVTRNGTGVANATVDVAADGNYSGTGTYRTDDGGDVDLPTPAENVTVTVTASSEGDEATATETLTTEFVEEQKNFGQSVTLFIESLRGAGFNGPPGQIISDFVTNNNPGNADDAKEDAPGQAKKGSGDANETDESEKRGPPEKAEKKGDDEKNEERKNDERDEKGKEDKQNGESDDDSDDDSDSEDDSDESDSEDDSDDGKQGPPDHAKGGK